MKEGLVPKNIKKLLEGLENYRIREQLPKTELARRLSVSYSTLKRWFCSSKAKHVPSAESLVKVQSLLNASKEQSTPLEQTWEHVKDWWTAQHRYPSIESFAQEVGFNALELEKCLEGQDEPPRLLVERVAQVLGIGPAIFGSLRNKAVERTERLKFLLTLLAEEIAWFRDSPKETRQVLRERVNSMDTGYISSMLTMIFEEEKFQRWLRATTNRFSYFRRRLKKK